MNYYTKLKMFYENKNSQFKAINFDDFIFSLKEEFLNNLIQYKNQLDIINFPSFYYEFNLFINEECNYCNFKNKNQIIQTNKIQSNNSTYRSNISIRNDRKENRTTRLIKGNNSYDEYRKCKKEEKDKSPQINKKGKKSIILIRQKTPSKSNKYNENFSFNKNNSNKNNFNKTMYNNQKINSVIIEDEKNNNIFGDVGNVVNYNKKFLYKK